jgi:hypothetical protein
MNYRFAMAIIPSVKSKAQRFNHATLPLTPAWRVQKLGANLRARRSLGHNVISLPCSNRVALD